MFPTADAKYALIDASTTLKRVRTPEKTRGLKKAIGNLQAKKSKEQRHNAPDCKDKKNGDGCAEKENLHASSFELDGSSFPQYFSAEQADQNRMDKHGEEHQ